MVLGALGFTVPALLAATDPWDLVAAAGVCLLFTAMYKFFEFGNRFVEAAQV